jgi:hypothetical protein
MALIVSSKPDLRAFEEQSHGTAGPGIGHAWLIDPSTSTIDVYRLVSGAFS